MIEKIDQVAFNSTGLETGSKIMSEHFEINVV